MKKLMFILFSLAILLSTAAVAQDGAAEAEQKPVEKVKLTPDHGHSKKIHDHKRGSGTAEARAQSVADRLFKSLGLSEAQKEEVYKIQLANHLEIRELYKQTMMDGETKRKKIRELREQADQKIIEDVLNEQQAQRFQEIIEKSRKGNASRNADAKRPARMQRAK